MKHNKLNYRILHFFILLIIPFLINSCGSDDNGGDEPKTFLEKYDGSVWTNQTGFNISFINNLYEPVKMWEYVTPPNCYEIEVFDEDDSNFLIIENSENKLVFEVGDWTYTYSLSGDSIIWLSEGIELGQIVYETMSLSTSSLNINNLTICN